MTSSHCTILAPIYTCRQVSQNRRQMHEWQSRSENYKRRDLRFKIDCCGKWVLTEKHWKWSTANERKRYRAEGSSRRGCRPQYQRDLVLFPYYFLRAFGCETVSPDRVVGNSSYGKVMQCENSDPATFKCINIHNQSKVWTHLLKCFFFLSKKCIILNIAH